MELLKDNSNSELENMMKFHINSKGEAKKCEASKRACRFGGEETHFTNFNEAQREAELISERESSTGLSGVQKPFRMEQLKKLKVGGRSIFNKNLNVEYRKVANDEPGYFNDVAVSGVVDYSKLNNKNFVELGFADHETVLYGGREYKYIPDKPFMTEAMMCQLSDDELDLTSSEKEAVNTFSSDNYEWMNDVLFSKDPMETLNDYERSAEYLDRLTKDLDSALNKAPSKQRTVYRGVRQDSNLFRDEQDNLIVVEDWVKDNLKVGGEIVFDGYQSSSPNPSVAFDYAGGFGDYEYLRNRKKGMGLVYEIITPDGLNISAESDYPEEQEVLLPRKSRYVVVNVEKVSLKTEDNKFTNNSMLVRLLAVNDRGEVSDGTNREVRAGTNYSKEGAA